MTKMSTPVGDITIGATKKGITFISWGAFDAPSTPHAETAKQQIQEYFAGTRTSFDVPFDLSGTPYQQRVWAAIYKIPFGETLSYADVALAIGSHPRAVGGATGKNPLPIIIPCHRVMGKNGALTGFSGGEGVATKEKFLQHEGIL